MRESLPFFGVLARRSTTACASKRRSSANHTSADTKEDGEDEGEERNDCVKGEDGWSDIDMGEQK